MIVFDLHCLDSGDVFEAWFRSGSDYEEQAGLGLVECPVCGSTRIGKAPMAPGIPAKTAAREAVIERLAEIQSAALRDSEWVGDRFADEARAIHLGESEARAVHGQATLAEARALVDEGIPVAQLPLPVVPPGQVN
jgi:hypothetical protein